jgi:hypothetical protein
VAAVEVERVVARAGGAVEVTAGTNSRAQKLVKWAAVTRCAHGGLINVCERIGHSKKGYGPLIFR